MAKKGKKTTSLCTNCIFDSVYPNPNDTEPHFFCAKMIESNESDESLRSQIKNWIYKDAEFNLFGLPIGKIIAPCPGFENKENKEN